MQVEVINNRYILSRICSIVRDRTGIRPGFFQPLWQAWFWSRSCGPLESTLRWTLNDQEESTAVLWPETQKGIWERGALFVWIVNEGLLYLMFWGWRGPAPHHIESSVLFSLAPDGKDLFYCFVYFLWLCKPSVNKAGNQPDFKETACTLTFISRKGDPHKLISPHYIEIDRYPTRKIHLQLLHPVIQILNYNERGLEKEKKVELLHSTIMWYDKIELPSLHAYHWQPTWCFLGWLVILNYPFHVLLVINIDPFLTFFHVCPKPNHSHVLMFSFFSLCGKSFKLLPSEFQQI